MWTWKKITISILFAETVQWTKSIKSNLDAFTQQHPLLVIQKITSWRASFVLTSWSRSDCIHPTGQKQKTPAEKHRGFSFVPNVLCSMPFDYSYACNAQTTSLKMVLCSGRLFLERFFAFLNVILHKHIERFSYFIVSLTQELELLSLFVHEDSL